MTVPPYGQPPSAPQPPGEPYPYPDNWPGPPPPPYPQWYPQPPRPTNALAIASMVCAVLIAPLGVVFGHISLSQIKRSGENGRGLAIAGLVVGSSLSVITVVLIVLAAMVFSWAAGELERTSAYPDAPRTPRTLTDVKELPRFAPPAALGADCQYPATGSPAAKRVRPPRSGAVPTDPATVAATMTTNDGTIGLELDNAKSPCTVNSFVSLAEQGYFDGTTCHRLAANNSLSVLQCGDPTGIGTGGPGYEFANEYPTNQYPPDDPELAKPVVYPRGTLAMANAGADTNGSQFFVVYEDSKLPPTYTVFGSVDETGLAIVDQIAAAGVTGGNLDGQPAQRVMVRSIRLD